MRIYKGWDGGRWSFIQRHIYGHYLDWAVTVNHWGSGSTAVMVRRALLNTLSWYLPGRLTAVPDTFISLHMETNYRNSGDRLQGCCEILHQSRHVYLSIRLNQSEQIKTNLKSTQLDRYGEFHKSTVIWIRLLLSVFMLLT